MPELDGMAFHGVKSLVEGGKELEGNVPIDLRRQGISACFAKINKKPTSSKFLIFNTGQLCIASVRQHLHVL